MNIMSTLRLIMYVFANMATSNQINQLQHPNPQSALKTMLPMGTTQRYYCRKYAKYIEIWNEKRHFDDMCIQCKDGSFELPFEPDEEEESEGNIHITPRNICKLF